MPTIATDRLRSGPIPVYPMLSGVARSLPNCPAPTTAQQSVSIDGKSSRFLAEIFDEPWFPERCARRREREHEPSRRPCPPKEAREKQCEVCNAPRKAPGAKVRRSGWRGYFRMRSYDRPPQSPEAAESLSGQHEKPEPQNRKPITPGQSGRRSHSP